MLHTFLALLLSLVGTALTLPQALDEAMIHGGSADIHLSDFYKALAKKDFKSMPDLYEKLENDRVLLKSDAKQLQNTEMPNGAKSIKRLMEIQLDSILFKINGLMPEPTPTTTTEKPITITSKKPIITTTKTETTTKKPKITTKKPITITTKKPITITTTQKPITTTNEKPITTFEAWLKWLQGNK